MQYLMPFMMALFAAIFVLAAVYAAPTILARVERAECIKWQEQSQQFPQWWAAQWQKEQCTQYGIDL